MKIHEWKRTATYYAMFIVCGAVSGMLGPSLVYLADLAQATVSQISVLFMARGIGNILGALLASRMYDRFAGHHYLILMLVCVIAGLWMIPFATSLTVLIAIFFLLGASEVSLNTGGNLMMLWLHREKVGAYVTFLHLCYSMGAMIAPMIFVFSMWLSGDFGWGFWLIALYSCLFPILLARQVSPAFPVSSGQDSVAPEKQTLRFYAYLWVVFLYVSFEISIAGWISTYGVLSGWDQEHAALLSTWFFLALSLGRLCFIPLQRWLTERQCVTGLLVISVLSSVAMIWLTNIHLGWVAFGLGFGCSALFPLMFSFANSILVLTGRRTGLVFVCCGLGALVAPSLSGPIIDHLGVTAFPWLLLLLALLLVGSWGRLVRIAGR